MDFLKNIDFGFLGTTGAIIAGVVVAFLTWVVKIYNTLIKKENEISRGWKDIDTVLKQRYDMIPNLVEIVKGYAAHEKETLGAVIEARSKAGQINIDIKKATPEQMAAFQASQSELGKTLGKLFALAEAYPDLKANTNFLDLQSKLAGLEDKLNMARRYYNGAIKDYNDSRRVFPANIVASIFGFGEKNEFDISDEERENVEIKF